MANLPLETNAKRPQFFDNDSGDIHTSMILELMAELWTIKERVYVLEQVLSSHDNSVKQQVENYHPSPEQTVELEAKRGVFIQNIMRSVEDINSKRHK